MSEFEPPSLLLRDGGAVVGTPWRIIGELDEHEDISGIACDADGSGLLVTDEGSLVHRFELQRRKRRLKLSPLTTMLLREGEEADLEGLCCDGTWFYAAGSHALGRNVPDHQPSRHHLYRLRFAGDRLEHETSHALEPMLENDRLLAGHFYKRLDSVERGVDIEGLAVRQDRLLIGLRGPALDGEAFVLSVPVEAVFGAKRSRLRTAERYALPLGEGAGVRDLATVQDGVLILGGPSTDDDRPPFGLWWWNGARKVVELGTFEVAAPAKAEGLLLLGESAAAFELLVVFDGVPCGAPHAFAVPRPR